MRKMKKIILFTLMLCGSALAFAQHDMKNMPDAIPSSQSFEKVNLSPGKTVRYDLYVTDTMVNYTGKTKHAIAVNGSTPMPTLYFTEGDTAEIYLHNQLKTETSLHWHGVFLPNRFDGVPNLTTAPIPPGSTHFTNSP